MPQALSRVPILELSRLLFALASWNPAGGDGLVLKTEGRADTQWCVFSTRVLFSNITDITVF